MGLDCGCGGDCPMCSHINNRLMAGHAFTIMNTPMPPEEKRVGEEKKPEKKGKPKK